MIDRCEQENITLDDFPPDFEIAYPCCKQPERYINELRKRAAHHDPEAVRTLCEMNGTPVPTWALEESETGNQSDTAHEVQYILPLEDPLQTTQS